MNRKFIFALLSLVCTLCLAIGLSACGLFGNESTNNNGQTDGNNTYNSDDNVDDPDSNINEEPTVDENGLVFTLSDDEVYYIVSEYKGTSGSVVIPSEYNGIPVTEIGEELFYFSTILTEITIPSSITSMGENAFGNYTYVSIENVYYGGTASQWASITFYGNSSNPLSLTNNFYLNGKLATNITIEGVTAINDYAFWNCTMLTSVTISDDVTSIGFGSFYGCSSLKNIEIPDSVTSIGGQAFNACSSLESLTLGTNLTTLGYESFRECSALNKIYFNATAMNDLSSYNSIFIRWQDGADISVTIGANVTKIPDYLFSATDNFPLSITDIVFEENSQCESIGRYAFNYCNFITSIDIPTHVTSIGEYAFYGCSSLEKVNYNGTASQWANISFGNSYSNPLCYANNLYLNETLATTLTLSDITTINAYAFYNCRSLINATIGNNVTSIGSSAFTGCFSLNNLTISNGVISIESYAFQSCTALINITIPESITIIENYAFSSCEKLIEVHNLSTLEIKAGSTDNGNVAYYAKNVYTISNGSRLVNSGDYIFYNDEGLYYLMGYTGTETEITLPDNINGTTYSIYDYAFYCNSSIISVDMTDEVTSIGFSSFAYCPSLTSVKIGNSVTSIGYMAFDNCTALSNLTIGNSVTSIANLAFQSCNSLTSVTIPKSVYSIGIEAFYLCRSITEYIVSSENTNYKAIDGNLYNYDGTVLRNYAVGKTDTSFTVPYGVTSISSYAFTSCSSLTSVTIPESVTSIGSYAFTNCSSLECINLSSNLTSINTFTFAYCTSLTNIAIPDNVTTIDSGAFLDCTALETITIGKNITSIGYQAFRNTAYYNNSNNWENNLLYIDTYLISAKTSISGECSIKEGTTVIANCAFMSCKSLTSITIPDSVTTIGSQAFDYCSLLASITIGSGVTYIDITAFNNTKYYNDEDNWENGVLYIENYLIKAKTSISGEYSIKDGTVLIANQAFGSCSSLTSIYIPDSVIFIGELAFYNCTSFKIIYYGGTADNWNNIAIDSDNKDLKSAARYYYSESQPTELGIYWHYNENGEIEIWTTD